MKKRVSLILMGSLIFLVGCWNYIEIRERIFVAGAGVDLADDDLVEVTVQALRPSDIGVPAAGTPTGENPVWVLSSQGETVFDAVRNFVRQSSGKLFWQYSEVFVISEEVAREGVLPILDFFIRDHELRASQKIVISKGRAKDIISASHGFENISAVAIANMLDANTALGGIVNIELFDFIKQVNSKSGAPVVGRIELLDGEELDVQGGAVFEEDRLKGFLNKRDTRGLNWILGEIESSIVVIEWEDESKVSIEILRANSKVEPQIKDGNLVINVGIETEGNIGGEQTRKDITPESWSLLEEKLSNLIKNEVVDIIDKSQKEFNLDIFGFADEVYRKYPKEWRRIEDHWESKFPTLLVEVEVGAKVRRPGVIRRFPKEG